MISLATEIIVHVSPAAHHLIGDGVGFLTIDDNGAAVKLRGSIVIKRGVTGHMALPIK